MKYNKSPHIHVGADLSGTQPIHWPPHISIINSQSAKSQSVSMVPTTEKVWEEFNRELKRFILKKVQDEPIAEDILQFSRVGTPLEEKNPGCASSYYVRYSQMHPQLASGI